MSSKLCFRTGLIVLAAFVLTIAKPLPAGEKEIKGAKEVKQATGKVVVKDLKESMLLLETADKNLSLTVTTTSAKRGLRKVNVGDKVSVTYTQTGTRLMAISITPEARPGGCPEGRPCPEEEKTP